MSLENTITLPVPENIGLVIEALAPAPPPPYDNEAAVKELRARAQKLFTAGEYDRGEILAYALKYKKAAQQEIEDVIAEYTFETSELKTQVNHNQEQLLREFLKAGEEKIGPANYAKWLTYYLNLNSINEILPVGSSQWRIIAWAQTGDILSKEYYDQEIQVIKRAIGKL